jgi:signal transduction histidine kinase
MEMTRRSMFVYGLVAAVWALVVVWQIEEHVRVREAAKTDLRSASKDIANTVGACIRASSFRQAVFKERLESILGELVYGRSNEVVRSRELLSIALLNKEGSNIVQVGPAIDRDILQEGEHWGLQRVVFVHPVDLGEGATNILVLLPRRRDMTNNLPPGTRGDGFPHHDEGHGPGEPPPPPPDGDHAEHGPEQPTGAVAGVNAGGPQATNEGARSDHGGPPRPPGSRRRRFPFPPEMTEQEFATMQEKQGLSALMLAMSTNPFDAASARDLFLRLIIVILATVSAAGSALAWRNILKSSDLQIRLVRASELNSHLKEMNLAAAGLAHETRNPLNIIRGLAQMVSRQPEGTEEIQKKSRQIVEEADKVAAQLNEFINYSRPREVRRTVLPLGSVIGEVVRTLNYDLEEKKIRLEIRGDVLSIEADEQLLRQALFNLLLNAIQAVNGDGQIEVVSQRYSTSEAMLEVRDNGPGVPAERRTEIFKPYFTTQKQGTGLGLAVVQQIVLAHGWEIGCLANEPHGAVFRLTHLKVVS